MHAGSIITTGLSRTSQPRTLFVGLYLHLAILDSLTKHFRWYKDNIECDWIVVAVEEKSLIIWLPYSRLESELCLCYHIGIPRVFVLGHKRYHDRFSWLCLCHHMNS